MARTEIITDDLTGESGAQSVRIAIDNTIWTIDLAKGSRSKLDKALAPFLAKATLVKVAGTTGGRSSTAKKPAKKSKSAKAATTDAAQRAAIREWAAKNKIELPSRGRIANAIIEQYNAAR